MADRNGAVLGHDPQTQEEIVCLRPDDYEALKSRCDKYYEALYSIVATSRYKPDTMHKIAEKVLLENAND